MVELAQLITVAAAREYQLWGQSPQEVKRGKQLGEAAELEHSKAVEWSSGAGEGTEYWAYSVRQPHRQRGRLAWWVGMARQGQGLLA